MYIIFMTNVPKLETYRDIFRKEVLPAFPPAQRRFERYFAQSCGVIRDMPLATHPGFRDYHPLAKTNRASKNADKRSVGDTRNQPGDTRNQPNPQLSVWLFDLDVALVALGIKPLALCSHAYSDLMHHMAKQYNFSMLFFNAGLEMRTNDDGSLEVYDPDELARAIRRNTGEDAQFSRVYDSLSSLEHRLGMMGGDYPHYLLGYPEERRIDPSTGKMPMELMAGSRGYLIEPESYYVAHFACKIADFQKSAPTLRARAISAALVEDIRKTPPEIESFAMIRESSPGDHAILQSVSIVRQENGPWSIKENKSGALKTA